MSKTIKLLPTIAGDTEIVEAAWHRARNAWMKASRHGTQEWADAEAVKALSTALPLIRSQVRGEIAAWRPIKSAPKDGTGILVIDRNAEKPEAGQAWYIAGVWTCVDPNGAIALEPEVYRAMYFPSPTDWQPLPAPPATAIEAGTAGEIG